MEGSYLYSMVQISGTYTEREKKSNALGKQLEGLVNSYAKSGWEFFRMDPFQVVVNPGCMGGIFGGRQAVYNDYVVTFRKRASVPGKDLSSQVGCQG
jgi:hypothetical protein